MEIYPAVSENAFLSKIAQGAHTIFQNIGTSNSEASGTRLISLLAGYYETRSPFYWLCGSPATEIWHLFDIIIPLED